MKEVYTLKLPLLGATPINNKALVNPQGKVETIEGLF